MPQNAIIKADGTGDYATLSAWAIAERTSNYGAPTRCYIGGVVASSAVVLFHTATGGWPNGAELYALTGQAFDGTNLSTCAAITHTTGPIDVGNVDVDVQGLLIDVTGGYNNKNIKFASSVSTTKRRKLTLKNVALRSSPNYHGSTCGLDLSLNSTNLNNQYDLDIADVIIIPRANNAAFSMTALSGTYDVSGTVKNITILPSNSGSSVKTGFYLGVGSACTVNFDSVLSLGSEARPAYVDYENLGLGGTAANIVTKDSTGTHTGKTTTTELENYAAGDYRLKKTGQQFGAFKQSGIVPVNYDIGGVSAISVAATGGVLVNGVTGGASSVLLQSAGSVSACMVAGGISALSLTATGETSNNAAVGGNAQFAISATGGADVTVAPVDPDPGNYDIGGASSFSVLSTGGASVNRATGGASSFSIDTIGGATLDATVGGASSFAVLASGFAALTANVGGVSVSSIAATGGATVNEEKVIIDVILFDSVAYEYRFEYSPARITSKVTL